MILGVNSADNKDIALEFLKKKGITFPVILDSSEEGQRVTNQVYRASAVPTTYVINPVGWIQASWVGYDGAEEKVKRLLRELKIIE